MIYAITEPNLHHYEHYEIDEPTVQRARDKLFEYFDREVDAISKIFEGAPDHDDFVRRAKSTSETKKINTNFFTQAFPTETYKRI